MKYETRVLLTRYGPPPPGPPQPTLIIFYAKSAWEKFVAAQQAGQSELSGLSVDWSRAVILLIKTIPEGGMDVTPKISSFTRDGDTVRIKVATELRPDAAGLDVQLQPWLIAEAPAEAFRKEPQILFVVKNQPEGIVLRERK